MGFLKELKEAFMEGYEKQGQRNEEVIKKLQQIGRPKAEEAEEGDKADKD